MSIYLPDPDYVQGTYQGQGISGEVIYAGDIIRRGSDNLLYVANNTSAANAAAFAIALSSCVKAGQICTYQQTGTVQVNNPAGSTFGHVGLPLFVATADSNYEDWGSISLTDWLTLIGYTASSSEIVLAFEIMGQYTVIT